LFFLLTLGNHTNTKKILLLKNIDLIKEIYSDFAILNHNIPINLNHHA
jgi:hypothetical protein